MTRGSLFDWLATCINQVIALLAVQAGLLEKKSQTRPLLFWLEIRNVPNLILSPTNLAPSLYLGLQKIARTPRARLQVGYRLVAPPGCPTARPFTGPRPRFPQLTGAAYVAFLSKHPAAGETLVGLPVGARLYAERLLAGGIVGERLPLANLRCQDSEQLLVTRGTLIDTMA